MLAAHALPLTLSSLLRTLPPSLTYALPLARPLFPRPDLMEVALNLMAVFGEALVNGTQGPALARPTPATLPNGGAVLAALAGGAAV